MPEVVDAHGRFVMGEGGELMVELPDADALEALPLHVEENKGVRLVCQAQFPHSMLCMASWCRIS